MLMFILSVDGKVPWSNDTLHTVLKKNIEDYGDSCWIYYHGEDYISPGKLRHRLNNYKVDEWALLLVDKNENFTIVNDEKIKQSFLVGLDQWNNDDISSAEILSEIILNTAT